MESPSATSLQIRLFLFCGLLLLEVASAWAVDPTHLISQYGHTAWRIQDGFFNGTVIAAAQTTDGYIWIGTFSGLWRFDGVRFAPFDPGKGQQLPSSFILSLLGSRDGSLWIGTDQGLSRWTNQGLTNLDHLRVANILEDRNGSIWYLRIHRAHQDSDLCQIVDAVPRCYGPADGMNISDPYPLIQDSLGNFWIGGSTTLLRWRPGSTTEYPIKGLSKNLGVAGVMGLVANPDGGMWVGIGPSGRSLGLQQLVDGHWRPFITSDLDTTTLSVSALLLDREGALWIGTLQHGIYRVYQRRVEHFSSVNGLSGDYVNKFYEDREGNMWVVTSKGVDLFRNLSVVTFSTHEGLSTEEVDSVFASQDGTIWVGGAEGLDGLRGDKVTSFRTGKGLPGSQVEAIFEDRAGQLWVGIDDDLLILKDGSFKPIKRPDRSSIGGAISITEDVDGNIWAESLYKGVRNLVRIRENRVQEAFPAPQMPAARRIVADPKAGIWLGLMNGDLAWLKNGQVETFHSQGESASGLPYVMQLIVTQDGFVLGATRFGLVAWKNGKEQTLTVRNGLPCDTVYAVVDDERGNLWLYAQCGLIEIARDQFQRWWEHGDSIVHPKVLDVFDGALPSLAPFPGAARSADGRLWFANVNVLQMVDPAHISGNELAPPVHVEEVVADLKRFSPDDGLKIPARTRDLEIDYAALSFGAPQKVLFHYQLEGRDTGWQDAETRRQAFYTDLRPGKYRFRVIACNNNGVWNEEGATLNLSVAPAWFQTIWFRVLCVILGTLVLWLLYRLRVRQVARALSLRFDERLAERTRIAREFHDTFLQTIQGSQLVANSALHPSTDPDRMRRAMGQLSGWLGRATQESRAALNSLRTSTTQGNDLAEAFGRAIEECRQLSSIEASFSVQGEAREMHPIVRDEVYRIGYEAIRNACAHSQGTQLEVELRYAHDLILRINDNGVGIDPVVEERIKDGHFGLQGMRERAARINGNLTIVSSSSTGTKITLVVPGRVVFREAKKHPLKRIATLFTRADRTPQS